MSVASEVIPSPDEVQLPLPSAARQVLHQRRDNMASPAFVTPQPSQAFAVRQPMCQRRDNNAILPVRIAPSRPRVVCESVPRKASSKR